MKLNDKYFTVSHCNKVLRNTKSAVTLSLNPEKMGFVRFFMY